MVPFINLIILILFCIKFIFSYEFKEYKKYKQDKRFDLKNEDYSRIADKNFEIKIEHFLAKMVKHAVQRTKRGSDLKYICYIYALFIILLGITYFFISIPLDILWVVFLVQGVTVTISVIMFYLIERFFV